LAPRLDHALSATQTQNPMNFQRRSPESPEINLIPFIDILLVVVIFLVITTSYTRVSGLDITLPSAKTPTSASPRAEIVAAVDSQGSMTLNGQAFHGQTLGELADAMGALAPTGRGAVVIVQADAQTPHQRVVDIMNAARLAGLSKLVFATRSANR
jgi:biopolymer transport protein ExbD